MTAEQISTLGGHHWQWRWDDKYARFWCDTCMAQIMLTKDIIEGNQHTVISTLSQPCSTVMANKWWKRDTKIYYDLSQEEDDYDEEPDDPYYL